MKRYGYTNPFDNFVGSHNDFPVVTKTNSLRGFMLQYSKTTGSGK